FRAVAAVSVDGGDEVGGAAIMQEEDALSQTPEGSGAELIASGAALRNVVGQARAHVVDFHVGEQIGGGGVEAWSHGRLSRDEGWCMARSAADRAEQRTAAADGSGAA